VEQRPHEAEVANKLVASVFVYNAYAMDRTPAHQRHIKLHPPHILVVVACFVILPICCSRFRHDPTSHLLRSPPNLLQHPPARLLLPRQPRHRVIPRIRHRRPAQRAINSRIAEDGRNGVDIRWDRPRGAVGELDCARSEARGGDDDVGVWCGEAEEGLVGEGVVEEVGCVGIVRGESASTSVGRVRSI
jgi:hypothetical protein